MNDQRGKTEESGVAVERQVVPLTVGELRRALEKLPDDAHVHLSDEYATWEARMAIAWTSLDVLSIT